MTLSELTSIHSVTIEEKTTTRGSAGGEETSWSTVVGAPTTARVVPMSAKESLDFQRSGLEVDTKIFFSSDPAMTSKKRVVYDGKMYLFAGELDWDNLARGWTVLARYIGEHPENV